MWPFKKRIHVTIQKLRQLREDERLVIQLPGYVSNKELEEFRKAWDRCERNTDPVFMGGEVKFIITRKSKTKIKKGVKNGKSTQ